MIMCKCPDYIEAAVRRLNEFLPEDVQVEEMDEKTRRKIPFGLSNAFDYYKIKVMGVPFILTGSDVADKDLPSTVISKQRDIIAEETGMTPIFIFKKIESYNFSRYAKRNLNIIVGAKQLFLPSLFLIVGKEKPQIRKAEEKAPIFFQLMTLYHLQKENLDGLTMRELADKLETSYATVNRGIRWMSEKGFVQLGDGKEKKIQFLQKGLKLWEKALEYLDTPIATLLYVPENLTVGNSFISDLNALAEYSLLNGGQERRAISRGKYRELKKRGIEFLPIGEKGVEIWKYNPALLAENGVVDRLSLYLLLKDHEDERVQIELDSMINEIEW